MFFDSNITVRFDCRAVQRLRNPPIILKPPSEQIKPAISQRCLMIVTMRNKYREVRKLVFEKSTEPHIANKVKHEENKSKFKSSVISLCNNADLNLYKSGDPEVKTRLWNHLWTKNRYAGIRAQITTEIKHITELFDNYRWFSEDGWSLNSTGFKVISAGTLAQSFLDRSGKFADKQTIGNVPKLQKIITVARAFTHYFDENEGKSAIDFVTQTSHRQCMGHTRPTNKHGLQGRFNCPPFYDGCWLSSNQT